VKVIECGWLGHAWVGYSYRLRSFGQWTAANCAAPPTANADQYTQLMNYTPPLFGIPCKWLYINMGTCNSLTFNQGQSTKKHW